MVEGGLGRGGVLGARGLETVYWGRVHCIYSGVVMVVVLMRAELDYLILIESKLSAVNLVIK